MLLFLDNCQAREVVSQTVSESSRGSGEDLTCAMGAMADGSLGTMRSMRRRDFLLAAAGALTLAGCSAGQQTRPPAASGVNRTSTTAAAAPSPRAAAPQTPQRRPGTPAEMLARDTVPVLCYHQIREVTANDGPRARPLICPPALLERHLQALSGAGMRPVTSSQLVDYVEFGTPLPPRPVVLSFDDASAGQFTKALPILQRLSMPATFFIITVVLNKPNWLSRDQVRVLDQAGMAIAAHTWDHHAVTQYTGTDWAIQLQQPKAELEQIIGHSVDLLGYPYESRTTAALPHVHGAGYRPAFHPRKKPQAPQLPLLTLRRLLVSSSLGEQDLLAQLQA